MSLVMYCGVWGVFQGVYLYNYVTKPHSTIPLCGSAACSQCLMIAVPWGYSSAITVCPHLYTSPVLACRPYLPSISPLSTRCVGLHLHNVTYYTLAGPWGYSIVQSGCLSSPLTYTATTTVWEVSLAGPFVTRQHNCALHMTGAVLLPYKYDLVTMQTSLTNHPNGLLTIQITLSPPTQSNL